MAKKTKPVSGREQRAVAPGSTTGERARPPASAPSSRPTPRSIFEHGPDRGYGPAADDIAKGDIPLRVIALYKFGLSVTRLQFGAGGEPRVLPGVIMGVPGNPMRINEGEQYLAFAALKLKDGQSFNPQEWQVVPASCSQFGLYFEPVPLVSGNSAFFANTPVKIADGTLGMSFYATRKYEIDMGFVMAYLRQVV